MLTPADILKFLGLALVLTVFGSFGFAVLADKSTDTAIKEATKQAMYASINNGCLRVDESITIDSDVAKSELQKRYRTLTNFENGITELYIYNSNETTPMMATEAYQMIDTPMDNALSFLKRNDFLGFASENGLNNNKVVTWENRIGIFEATSKTKPITAEFKNYNSIGSSVEDFQCN